MNIPGPSAERDQPRGHGSGDLVAAGLSDTDTDTDVGTGTDVGAERVTPGAERVTPGAEGGAPASAAPRPGATAAPRRSPGTARPSRGLVEWVAVLGLALVAALALRAWVVQAFYIPSGSMEPTLDIGDRIVVDKLSYDLHAVHRGDIIVFARPSADTVDPNISDLVKRVIGLPGETISSGPNGEVLIDGKAIAQPWASFAQGTGPPVRTQVIPPGRYFVMGDNRGDSEDSRYFGTVAGRLIVGRVVARVWPLGRAHLFGL